MSEMRDVTRADSTSADQTSTDPVAEGAQARAQGRPKDACPYPAGSPERAAWLEAYDGIPAGRAPDLPMDNG